MIGGVWRMTQSSVNIILWGFSNVDHTCGKKDYVILNLSPFFCAISSLLLLEIVIVVDLSNVSVCPNLKELWSLKSFQKNEPLKCGCGIDFVQVISVWDKGFITPPSFVCFLWFLWLDWCSLWLAIYLANVINKVRYISKYVEDYGEESSNGTSLTTHGWY